MDDFHSSISFLTPGRQKELKAFIYELLHKHSLKSVAFMERLAAKAHRSDVSELVETKTRAKNILDINSVTADLKL